MAQTLETRAAIRTVDLWLFLLYEVGDQRLDLLPGESEAAGQDECDPKAAAAPIPASPQRSPLSSTRTTMGWDCQELLGWAVVPLASAIGLEQDKRHGGDGKPTGRCSYRAHAPTLR